MTAEQQKRKKWLKTDSPSFRALTALVEDKNLLRDIAHMALFKHTGMSYCAYTQMFVINFYPVKRT